MAVVSNKVAMLVLGLSLSGSTLSTSHVTTMAFQPSSLTTPTHSSSTTSLNNMLRDYADYSSPRGPYSDHSGAQSSNWRKNQGYTTSSTPDLFGGSYRDAETNPYYDPGWAQSTRRDNPAANFDSGSNYNGYDDPRNRVNRGYWNSVTYPGVGDSYRSSKVYTNPTNPYYDPIWSQSYDHEANYEPIREEEHRMYYGAGYDRDYFSGYPDYGYGAGGGGMMMNGGGGKRGGRAMGMGEYQGGYRGGRGDAFGGYGRMNGPGRGLLATAQQQDGGAHKKKWMEARTAGYKGINGNSLMRIGRKSESNSIALRMSYPIYDEFDGPFLPPGMGGPGMMGGPGDRMMEGRWGPGMRRNGRGGGRGGPRRGPGGPMGPDGMGMSGEMDGRGPMRGEMGGRGMGGGPSMGGPGGWGPGGPGGQGPGGFGRDKAVGRMSLKDMAARTTQSYDAEVISSMNNRNNNNNGQSLPGDSMGPMMNQQRGGGSPSDPTSTASQYVPLSSTYGPQATERSPPLSVGAPPPEPIIETRAKPDVETSSSASSSSSSSSTPSTVQTARSVRPSVVLVTSTGKRNENSQGSGFVVEFDDAGDDTDIEEVDRCYILTSAHVAPPGWKVSVTFPSDPAIQYAATVVGRKLNSDLALLSVECSIDDNDEDPFPVPLVLSSDDVLTDTKASSSSSLTSDQIGSPLYAFGYPMGLEGPTMTSGILSATTKGINYMDAPTGEEPSEISKSRPFERTSFVITDAAMAGGMSGGPLVNSDGVVLGVNALVRPDLRALGNYAVSSIECESFLEKLEDQREADANRAARKEDTRRERRKKRKKEARSKAAAEEETSSSIPPDDDDDGVPAEGVAGYRVMLYGYSTSKAEATKILRRAAGLDELRAENAMRSAYSFGAGVVDEFYVSEAGDRKRAERASKKKAEELLEKLKEEGMMVEVEPLTLLP